MKIILTTLNSKYIHTNLAIRYLKEYVKDLASVDIMEFTINQTMDDIVGEIYKRKPTVLGFSTYIWNVEQTLKIAETIKIILPNTKILLGGPEVSFDSVKLLKEHKFIDYIIYGEGEETFRELINNNKLSEIDGLIYRDGEEITINSPRKLIDKLERIPSPYENIGKEFENKIAYYESSRGCPFSCKFCLSSTIKGVRYFPIDRVKKDILNLIKAGVSQVKFVDRTFNANKLYSMEIMKYIMNLDPKDINFHFEITAHLIDDAILEFLKTPKEGLFQFEIGVQSTNPMTINAISRVTDFGKLKRVTTQIKNNRNIHQHLDLIAGLPYEDYTSFKKSFNDVYSIKPEKLQLGFLKLLKGSDLREKAKEYGFKYLNKPPYEVLSSNYMSYSDIYKLKGIEDIVEKYYNEGYFAHSIQFIIGNFFDSPFDFYEDYAQYWNNMSLNNISHSRNSQYQILLDYYNYKEFDNIDSFKELLKFDYLFNNKKITLPVGIKRLETIPKGKIHELLKEREFLNNCLPEKVNIPTKVLIKDVIIEGFNKDVLTMINSKYVALDRYEEKYLLFYYENNVINKCKVFDVTKFVRS